MKRRIALLAFWLLVSLLLCGCAQQVSERPLEDLFESEIEAGVTAPEEDTVDARTMAARLYFLSEDGRRLSPVVRSIEMEGGVSLAQAVVSALLEGPAEDETGVMWPDLGASRSGRFVEVSGDIATVDLPAHARTLPQQTLYAVRMAIASTLTELGGISYVNVLIGGREEGLDLGATLPVGTFTRVEDLDAGARYSRLLEQRQSSSGVTLLSSLYFPSGDGTLILPEVRSVLCEQVSPIEYLYTLLRELGKGPGGENGMQDVPAPMDYIEEMPEIVRTEDGYVAIELRFNDALPGAIEDAGLTLGVYMAMLTDTLMGFVPGVEGLRVSIGESVLTGVDAQDTPDGRPIVFKNTIAVRSDFSGYVGTPTTLYVMDESGGLERIVRPLGQSQAADARARLEALMRLGGEGKGPLPDGLTGGDILAVHTGETQIVLNLSEAFADALSALSARQERGAVYAMVNTLTQDNDIARVYFFFEGEQRQSLGGALEMRGCFMRNPGMVVN